jgi:transcriptional regulator with GAF, ATPase, and Fis domain
MSVRSLPVQKGMTAPVSSAVEVFAAIAKSVGDPDTIAQALSGMVKAARDLLDADRATLLLAEDGCLTPAVSIARQGNDELWARFRDMPPMRVGLNPEAKGVLAVPRVTVVDTAAGSTIIPREWSEAFGLTSVAFVPLLVQGVLHGVLAVDHAGQGPHRFSDEQLRILEGIGAFASHAVGIARTRELAAAHLESVEQMLRISARLNAADSLESVLDTAADAFLKLLDGHTCVLTTLEADGSLQVLASRGSGTVRSGRWSRDSLSDSDREELRLQAGHPSLRLWPTSETRPGGDGLLVRAASGGRVLIVPFVEMQRARGLALVGLDKTREASQETRFYALSLANHVWSSINQARTRRNLERQLAFLQTLNEAFDDIAIKPDMRLIVERLAPILRRVARIEILDVVLRDAQAAKLFAATRPRGIVARQMRELRHADAQRWVRQDSLLVVPLLVEGEVIGALQARLPHSTDPTAEEAELLITCASQVAALVARTSLRVKVAAGEREIAIAEDRARTQQQFQEVVGRYLAQIRSQLQQEAADSPAAIQECLDLVHRTEVYLRQSVTLPGGHVSKPASLQLGLNELLEAETRVDAALRVRGKAWELPVEVEHNLLRVTARWLALARTSGATIASATLGYSDDRVELSLSHNGAVSVLDTRDDLDIHAALSQMREWMREAGGTLSFRRVTAGVIILANVTKVRAAK